MKKTSFILLSLLVSAFCCLADDAVQDNTRKEQPAVEQTKQLPISLYANLTWESKHISNGLVANPDPVVCVTAGLSAYGFYADIYGIMDMTGFNNGDDTHGAYTNDRRYRFEELDYTIGYRHTFDTEFSPISAGVFGQYIHYSNAKHMRNGGKDRDIIWRYWVTLDDLLPSETYYLSTGLFLSHNVSKSTAYGFAHASIGCHFTEKLSGDIFFALHVANARRNQIAGEDIYGNTKTYYHECAATSLEITPALHYAINDNFRLTGFMRTTHLASHVTREKSKNGLILSHDHEWEFGIGIDFKY